MKYIRTKPNKNNRVLLENVKSKYILEPEKIGVRNIVQADRQLIVKCGLNIPDINGTNISPINFHPFYPIRYSSITYEESNALLSATPGHVEYVGQPGDPSSLFAPNLLAEQLFLKSKPGSDTYYTSLGGVFGDAVLITDTRQHWTVCTHRLKSASQADDLSAFLTTPHIRSKRYSHMAIPDIVFVEEPCADDLIQLTMMFG